MIPDQDTFYDILDALEDQGMERIIQQTSRCRGVRPDLLEQFRRYETMLRQEDGEDQSKNKQQLDLIENVRYVRTQPCISDKWHASGALAVFTRGPRNARS